MHKHVSGKLASNGNMLFKCNRLEGAQFLLLLLFNNYNVYKFYYNIYFYLHVGVRIKRRVFRKG